MIKACILAQESYKPGDLPPEGYLAWHEWAEIQYKAGVKQVECGICGKAKTPQELSGKTVSHTYQSKNGDVEIVSQVCTQCDDNDQT